MSIKIATAIFTHRSPSPRVIQFDPVPQKEIEKKIKVSIVEPTKEDVKGAINHFFFLSLSKICTSINCAVIKAVPEPIAIRIEIKSEKFVEK